ncbi:hypothetical protein [Nocardia altamirensis]|uniref:hypothetical protein n=1 Tax=Nocardia altamirensis TaxID=472158 RepID=UPI00114CE5A2|nr:hypothetical protein [Nocardia altamirensis]
MDTDVSNGERLKNATDHVHSSHSTDKPGPKPPSSDGTGGSTPDSIGSGVADRRPTLSHEPHRVPGIGQTDAELAQRRRGIDSRAKDRSLVNDLDYHRLYLEAQRFDFSDETVWDEVLHLGLVSHGHSELAQTLRQQGFRNLPFPDREKVVRLGLVNQGDPALAHILRRQGFDGPARLVDADGMREAVDNGWTELARAVHRPQDAEDFKTGDFFAGRGTLGNGTYAYGRESGSSDVDSAQLHGIAENWAGNVIHMAMHPDALKTDLHALKAEQENEIRSIGAELAKEPQHSARRTELEERRNVLSDLGRYGAALGWDAYKYRGRDSDVWVVLNRTALIVER